MARLPWALLLAAVGFIAIDQLRPKALPAPLPVQRFDILLPENTQWVGDILSVLALSPDGTLLAYNGQDSSGHRRLYLRAMGQPDPVVIQGSENGQFPFFSPDGNWVGYRSGSRLVKSPVRGGAPQTICETNGGGMGTWLESNTVVFTDSTGLRQCSSTGSVTTLLASDSAEFSFPHGLPGDRGVLFSIRHGSVNRLAVLDLRTKTMKSLDLVGSDPRYVETGHLVYASSDGLVRAVPFDPERLATTGEPVILPEAVRVEFGVAVMALSRTGTIVLAPRSTPQRALELVDRSGRAERLHPRLAEFSDPRFSPDGRRIALSMAGNIWLLDRTQGSLTRLSFDTLASRPAWSADGRRVAYLREIGRTTDVRFIKADGSAAAQSLPGLDGFEPWEVLLTPDGRSAVVRTVERSGSRDIWLLALDSARQPMPLLQTPANEVAPALSANGRWLAYVSNESGRPEVYVRAFPSMEGRFAVSLEGGTEPVWSRRGDELFYRSGPLLIAAQVRAGTSFEVLRRTPLFTNPAYEADLTHQVYDVAPDGQHFVMVRNLGATSHLTVTLQLFQHLGDGGPRGGTGSK
jgi:serine/threonine-protein kinase